MTKPIQNGIVTYHQDQSIKWVILSTTKHTPNKPKTPIPELLFEFSIIKIRFAFLFF